jgi:hypothetical protein
MNRCFFYFSVATFLNVGGPILGTPKAFGEMKDTAVLGDLGRNILGKVVGKLVVFPRFFRALGSIPSMFPRGKEFYLKYFIINLLIRWKCCLERMSWNRQRSIKTYAYISKRSL